jgi:hypothetical protein
MVTSLVCVFRQVLVACGKIVATIRAMKKLRIDIGSDIACPGCYVGKRRLEAALARFPEPDSVKLVWRAFEIPQDRSSITRRGGRFLVCGMRCAS